MQVVEIVEAPTIGWKRQGNNKVVRKYRCTTGPRKGQVRSSPAACNAPIKLKNRVTLKINKAKHGSHGKVMRQRTKSHSPASKRLRTLNKPRKRNVR